MAKKKATRILFRDLVNVFEMMSPEGAKKMIISLLKYEVGESVFDYYQVGEEGAGEFNKIIETIQENEKKYREVCESKKKAAAARWNKDNDLQPNEDFDNKPVEPTNTPEPIKESAPTSKAPETAPNEAKIPCTIPSSEGYSQQNEEIYIETLFRTIWQERSGELSNIYVQLQGNDDWTTYYHRLKTIMSSYNLQKDVERQVLNKIEAYLKDNYNNQIRIQATA